jgi:hypothetical protein
MPCITARPGRHAADRERERAAAQAAADLFEIHSAARGLLARTLTTRGLRVFADLSRPGGHEPSIGVNCSAERSEYDQAVLDATLDELGWQPDPYRTSRITHRYESLRLHQPASGARVLLLVHIPNGVLLQKHQWEAA